LIRELGNERLAFGKPQRRRIRQLLLRYQLGR
jgi:hypothetical protein